MKRALLLLLILLPISVWAQFKEYAQLPHLGCTFRVFTVRIDEENVKKFDFAQNPGGLPHYSFLRAEAINTFSDYMWITGTTYDASCKPLGLYVSGGRTVQALNTEKTGQGNFFMQPNGAFLITKNNAFIVETDKVNTITDVQLGLQSGPMMISNGVMNSQFQKKSTNYNLRSGVGVYTDKKDGGKYLVFAVSKHPVNFYTIASLFAEKFGCTDALCLTSANCAISLPFEINEQLINQSKVCCSYFRFKAK